MLKYLIIFCTLILSSFTYSSPKDGKVDITKISSDLFLHTSYKTINKKQLSSNGAIFIDSGYAYLIDTPWNESDMPQLLNWLKSKGLKLKAAVVTHAHEDRTAGLEFLNKHNYTTYASKKTNSLLKKQNKPVANHSFSTNSFKLANNKIEVFSPGAGHSSDNIVVYLPTIKALIGGCIIRSKQDKNLGWLGDAMLNKWHQSVTNISQRYNSINVIIPGHGKIGDRSLLTHTSTLAKNK